MLLFTILRVHDMLQYYRTDFHLRHHCTQFSLLCRFLQSVMENWNVNETNCPNVTVMADWASKANYNNPLFTIYHTLQFAKHKGMYWGEKEVYRLLRPRMRENFRYASRAPPSWTGARNVKDGPFSGVLSPRVILRSSACTFCHTGMFCRRIINILKNSFRAQFVTLFQQHCNTSFLFPRCVYRCAWMRSRTVLRCFIIPASDKD